MSSSSYPSGVVMRELKIALRDKATLKGVRAVVEALEDRGVPGDARIDLNHFNDTGDFGAVATWQERADPLPRAGDRG